MQTTLEGYHGPKQVYASFQKRDYSYQMSDSIPTFLLEGTLNSFYKIDFSLTIICSEPLNILSILHQRARSIPVFTLGETLG